MTDLTADLATLRRVLGDCERVLNDAWEQWAYEDSQGRKHAGGLSTLEQIEALDVEAATDAYDRVEAELARLRADLDDVAHYADLGNSQAFLDYWFLIGKTCGVRRCARLQQALEQISETAVLCTHTEVSDWWGEERGHPTHYRCLTCNDLFPVIGDTDLWKPVEIRKETA